MGSKSKKAAARLGDIDTGHHSSPPTPIIMGSPNVSTNGRPAARKGDKLIPHHPSIRTISEGSASVLINGKPAARVSDAINCGGDIIIGSGNVLIGDQPEAPRNAKLAMEFDELMGESFEPGFRELTPHQQAEVAANIAVKYRQEEGGVSSWHEYYYNQSENSNAPSPGELIDPLKQQGYQRAQNEKAKEAAEAIADANDINKAKANEVKLEKARQAIQDAIANQPEGEEATKEVVAAAGLLLGAMDNRTTPSKSEVASFEEAEQRLADAREEIQKRKQAGEPPYKPKYSDTELLEMVETGPVANERFLVSVQPKNTAHDATLAHQKDSGLVPVWTTSLDQLEAADTDPELIHQVLGAHSNYDPDKEYVMHIIDRGENLENFGNNTIVPDWDNLADASVRELGGPYDEDIIRETMNSEYQEVYAARMEEFWSAGGNQFTEEHIDIFSGKLGGKHSKLFVARHKIRTEIGANTEFTGNGLTASTAEGGGEFGVVETLSLEKNLPKLSDLQDPNNGIVKTINLIPQT